MQSDKSVFSSQRAKTVLVFPVTHPDGLKYYDEARESEVNVVAASSEWDAEVAMDLGELLLLPYIYEETFPDHLQSLIQAREITHIYAPVAVVHVWLERFISTRQLPVELVGASPLKREMNRFSKLMMKVVRYRKFIDECAMELCTLDNLEVAAVFRMASNIYGESNEIKIAAMMAIFASAPKGDVVEIGSLVGKSVSVLTWMAKRYQIGNVLAVDPWSAAVGTQNDSPDIVRVHIVNECDFESLPQDFLINILPVGIGSFNYLHHESAKGCEMFKANHTVESKLFGKTYYKGTISVIHIDGNHDYAMVKQDCELWLPLLARDGWLILDDYLWAHGDGPRRVGDALLIQRAQEIERAFVCGKALFIKFCHGPK